MIHKNTRHCIEENYTADLIRSFACYTRTFGHVPYYKNPDEAPSFANCDSGIKNMGKSLKQAEIEAHHDYKSKVLANFKYAQKIPWEKIGISENFFYKAKKKDLKENKEYTILNYEYAYQDLIQIDSLHWIVRELLHIKKYPTDAEKCICDIEAPDAFEFHISVFDFPVNLKFTKHMIPKYAQYDLTHRAFIKLAASAGVVGNKENNDNEYSVYPNLNALVLGYFM